jgi:hypothetical protein
VRYGCLRVWPRQVGGWVDSDTYALGYLTGIRAPSGCDPRHPDRLGASYPRYVARQIVDSAYADYAEVRLSFLGGSDDRIDARVALAAVPCDGYRTVEAQHWVEEHLVSPAAFLEDASLYRPIYRSFAIRGYLSQTGYAVGSSGERRRRTLSYEASACVGIRTTPSCLSNKAGGPLSVARPQNRQLTPAMGRMGRVAMGRACGEEASAR